MSDIKIHPREALSELHTTIEQKATLTGPERDRCRMLARSLGDFIEQIIQEKVAEAEAVRQAELASNGEATREAPAAAG